MRAHHTGMARARRFPRVVPAAFHQAAADKGQIGDAVQQHSVCPWYRLITTWCAARRISPLLRRVAEAGFLHQLPGGREAFR